MASDNSWFWIHKKQATGVSILVHTVKLTADIISWHSGSMKAKFIIKMNSHPCNEISEKMTNIKVCEMHTVSRPERSGCDRFCTGNKKQYNLDY